MAARLRRSESSGLISQPSAPLRRARWRSATTVKQHQHRDVRKQCPTDSSSRSDIVTAMPPIEPICMSRIARSGLVLLDLHRDHAPFATDREGDASEPAERVVTSSTTQLASVAMRMSTSADATRSFRQSLRTVLTRQPVLRSARSTAVALKEEMAARPDQACRGHALSPSSSGRARSVPTLLRATSGSSASRSAHAICWSSATFVHNADTTSRLAPGSSTPVGDINHPERRLHAIDDRCADSNSLIDQVVGRTKPLR